MRGMILAAGRGERMGTLTQHTPKPLLMVAGKYLIVYAIEKLVAAGICDIVINTAYLGSQIQTALGNGSQFGANIIYSHEEERLETGGGIVKALPLLGPDPFIVISGDIITDYPLQNLPSLPTGLAHLVLVANPSYKSQGDFGLDKQYVSMQASPRLTFGNMGVYRPELFSGCKNEYFPLSQLLFPAIAKQLITGEVFTKYWHNVGSPQELTSAANYLAHSN